MSLNGKIAIVTDAASGIGRASATAWAAEGAVVALVDRNAAALQAVQAELGDATHSFVADVTRPGDASVLIDEAIGQFGQIDIVHANSGSYVGGDVVDNEPDDWDRMMRLNANSVFRLVHAVRQQVARHGLRVGEISPGITETPMLDTWTPDNPEFADRSRIALPAKEIADAVVFMVTRPRNVTVRDIVILPQMQEI